MKRIAVWAFASGLATFAAAASESVAPALSAAQIIEKNVAARGGLDAWRKIGTMVWAGHIETAHAPASRMPFILEQKRPNKTRFELRVQNQSAVRIFDGTQGWTLRPSAGGQPELQPFSRDELSFAHDGPGLDGPLLDAAAGTVTVEGVDEIEGHRAYRLSVTRPSGVSQRVWIDAQTFLDLKSERPARNAAGQSVTATVVYRNYRAFEGVQLPLTIETGTETATAPDRMVIDKVALNPPLDDQRFAKPPGPGPRRGVTVDTRAQAVAP